MYVGGSFYRATWSRSRWINTLTDGFFSLFCTDLWCGPNVPFAESCKYPFFHFFWFLFWAFSFPTIFGCWVSLDCFLNAILNTLSRSLILYMPSRHHLHAVDAKILSKQCTAKRKIGTREQKMGWEGKLTGSVQTRNPSTQFLLMGWMFIISRCMIYGSPCPRAGCNFSLAFAHTLSCIFTAHQIRID